MSGSEPQRPPIPQAPLVDARGYVTREWWRWFHNVGLVEVGNTTNVISTIIQQAGDTNFSGGISDPAGLAEGSRKTLSLQPPADVGRFPDQIFLQAKLLGDPSAVAAPEQPALLAQELRPPQDPLTLDQAALLALEFDRAAEAIAPALDQASQAALQICTPADALPLDQLALLAALLVPPAPPSTAAAASTTSTPTADWDDPLLGSWGDAGWGEGGWSDQWLGSDHPGDSGQVWMSRGASVLPPEWVWYTPHTKSSTFGNPAATTSTTAVHMGLAGSFTPSQSGTVDVTSIFSLSSTGGGDHPVAQLAYGTGSAPTNGTAQTGTLIGNLADVLQSAANQTVPGVCNAILTGLTPGTAYWFDLCLYRAGGGGSQSIFNPLIKWTEY